MKRNWYWEEGTCLFGCGQKWERAVVVTWLCRNLFSNKRAPKPVVPYSVMSELESGHMAFPFTSMLGSFPSLMWPGKGQHIPPIRCIRMARLQLPVEFSPGFDWAKRSFQLCMQIDVTFYPFKKRWDIYISVKIDIYLCTYKVYKYIYIYLVYLGPFHLNWCTKCTM